MWRSFKKALRGYNGQKFVHKGTNYKKKNVNKIEKETHLATVKVNASDSLISSNLEKTYICHKVWQIIGNKFVEKSFLFYKFDKYILLSGKNNSN